MTRSRVVHRKHAAGLVLVSLVVRKVMRTLGADIFFALWGLAVLYHVRGLC